MEQRVLLKEQVQLEPIECHALEARLHEDDSSMVIVESKGAVLIVQFALDQENAKFAGIGPVKLFRFMDSCLEGRGKRLLGATGRTGQASDSLSQLSHDPTGYGLICISAKCGQGWVSRKVR